MKKCHYAASLGFLLICSQCGIGPKYSKPAVRLPKSFMHKKHRESTPADIADWWQTFNDETLNGLIQQAIKQNYTLQMALEKIVQAREQFSMQAAAACPEIDLTGNAMRQLRSKTMVASSVTPNLNVPHLQAGFDLLWELDIWGRLYRQKNAAYKQYEAEVEATRDVLLMVLSEVARVYITYCSYTAQKTLLEKLVATETFLLALQKDLHKAGLADGIAVANQEASVEAAKTQAVQMQTLKQVSVVQLALLLGQQPETFSLRATCIPRSNKPLNPGLPSDLLRRRPDIRRAERLLDLSQDLVVAATAELYPQFSLLQSVNLETNQSSKLIQAKSISWQLGPSFRWPILTFGRVQAHIREEQSKQREALLAYSQSITNALGDVEQALISYYDAEKTTQLGRRQQQARNKSYQLTKQLETSGLASSLETAHAQKALLTAQMNLLATEQAESVALIAVYKSLGGEW